MNGSVAMDACRDLRVEQAGKVGVKAFIPADELIGEGQPMHEPPLLQPEDATEAACQQLF